MKLWMHLALCTHNIGCKPHLRWCSFSIQLDWSKHIVWRDKLDHTSSHGAYWRTYVGYSKFFVQANHKNQCKNNNECTIWSKSLTKLWMRLSSNELLLNWSNEFMKLTKTNCGSSVWISGRQKCFSTLTSWQQSWKTSWEDTWTMWSICILKIFI